tara:strand:- start:33 stop:1127 length:1095 start_codon:yes stop_codon:yes gene_type:complete
LPTSCTKEFVLDASISPVESGTVIPSEGTYKEGSIVTLNAYPGSEYFFDSWSGDASGSSSSIDILVDGNKNIVANFSKTNFNVLLSVQGQGLINEQLIKSGPVEGQNLGDIIELIAIPEKGWSFNRWEGAPLNTNSDTLIIEINNDLVINAVFVQGEVFGNKNKYLALGDSYTIGESVDVKQKWPVQLLDKLSKVNSEINELEIIAQTGWTAQQLITATAELTLEPPYGLVSLLIGVNNQFQGQLAENFRPSFIELIDRAIILSGNIKERVFVLSIPDWGATPFANSLQRSEITKQINEFNGIIKYEAEQRNVKFYNITDISRNALNDLSLIANDNLHPSGKMYAQWVSLIEKDILSINFSPFK